METLVKQTYISATLLITMLEREVASRPLHNQLVPSNKRVKASRILYPAGITRTRYTRYDLAKTLFPVTLM